MAKCIECENALIGRSHIVKPISSTQRMVSDWTIDAGVIERPVFTVK